MGELKTQALVLLLFFALGLALGLLYDILTPLRRSVGRIAAAGLELLFTFCAAAAVFLLALSCSPDAHSGVWQLSAACAGFILYINLFGSLSTKILRVLINARTKKTGKSKKNLKI